MTTPAKMLKKNRPHYPNAVAKYSIKKKNKQTNKQSKSKNNVNLKKWLKYKTTLFFLNMHAYTIHLVRDYSQIPVWRGLWLKKGATTSPLIRSNGIHIYFSQPQWRPWKKIEVSRWFCCIRLLKYCEQSLKLWLFRINESMSNIYHAHFKKWHLITLCIGMHAGKNFIIGIEHADGKIMMIVITVKIPEK